MPEPYVSLPPEEKRKSLANAAAQLRKPALILEKDFWMCWALDALFSIPGHHPMVFKGGTSLSKAYSLIDRFSEDVDITLDYRHFGDEFDPFASGASRTGIKNFIARLQQHVRSYVLDAIVPALTTATSDATSEGFQVEVDEIGERVWFRYPSAIRDMNPYIKKHVLLEIGSRGVTEPSQSRKIIPYIAGQLQDMEFPAASARVLLPARTLWEKIVLLHVESHRNRRAGIPERHSRHWYDVAMMIGSSDGKKAVADRQMLREVIGHQKVFFHSGYANYDDCLSGKARLVPESGKLAELQDDYEQMRSSGMLAASAPDFESIIRQLRAVEGMVNS